MLWREKLCKLTQGRAVSMEHDGCVGVGVGVWVCWCVLKEIEGPLE